MTTYGKLEIPDAEARRLTRSDIVDRLLESGCSRLTAERSQAVRELLSARAVAGTGLTPDEYAVLGAIAVLRASSPTELAARLRIPATSMSRHVARLGQRGLVVRAPHPSDRRSYLLELTDDGRRAVRMIAPRVRRLVEELGQRADVDEIEAALVRLEHAVRELLLDTVTTVR
jgi:DNA-binding MarR family transcriptional regulator